MKCTGRRRNKKGDIIGYAMEDTDHNRRIFTPVELKLVLQSKKGICLNVGLSNSGELIYSPLASEKSQPKSTGITGTKISVTETNASKCKKHIMRNKLIGCEDAIYEIKSADEVVLKKVLVTHGEYTIPEFVTAFADGPQSQPQVRGVFDDCRKIKVRNNSCSIKNYDYIFGFCPYLAELDLSEFSIAGATSLSGLFYNDIHLRTLDLHSFDTSKVQSMVNMFYYCTNIRDLDLSSFDTSHVVDMSTMFRGCNSLQRLNISSFDTSHVMLMLGMFEDCCGIQSIDLSHFDTHNVTNMMYMFESCLELTKLDLRSFNTSKVTSMGSMFGNCRALASLDISSFDTSSVSNMATMFHNCHSLSSLDVSHFNLRSLKNARSMFENCNLKSFNLGSNVETLYTMGADPRLDVFSEEAMNLWRRYRRLE